MKVSKTSEETLNIELTEKELLMIMSGMREICFGVNIHAFDTRLGFTKPDMQNLANELHNIIEDLGIEE